MAEFKISQLPADTYEELNDEDVMPIVDNSVGVTKKISLFDLDKRWKALPNGGTVNQVLAKLSNLDGNVQWLTLTKASVGLGQVNNTADIDKPLSTAAINALNTKASTASVAVKADKSYVDNELTKKLDKPTVPATDGQILASVGGVPVWQDSASGNSPIKYFGEPTVNGTWRMRVDGATFKTEVRVADEWVLVQELNIP